MINGKRRKPNAERRRPGPPRGADTGRGTQNETPGGPRAPARSGDVLLLRTARNTQTLRKLSR